TQLECVFHTSQRPLRVARLRRDRARSEWNDDYPMQGPIAITSIITSPARSRRSLLSFLALQLAPASAGAFFYRTPQAVFSRTATYLTCAVQMPGENATLPKRERRRVANYEALSGQPRGQAALATSQSAVQRSKAAHAI